MAWNDTNIYRPFSCLSVDGIPYDGVPENEIVTVQIAATSILCILTTCGIVMTIVFLIFNFGFRERKWVVLIPYKCCFIHVCACVVLLYEVALIHCACSGGLVIFSLLSVHCCVEINLHSHYIHTHRTGIALSFSLSLSIWPFCIQTYQAH